MLKKITLFFACIALPFAGLAQEIDFKIEYRPNNNYTIQSDIDMDIIVTRNNEELQKQAFIVTALYKIKTGAAKEDTTIPFTASLKAETRVLRKLEGIKSRQVFSGYFSNGRPVIDTLIVDGTGVPHEEFQVALNKVLMQYDDIYGKIEVGDTFKIEIPFDMGMDLGIKDLDATCTLQRVEGDSAFFETILDIPVDITTRGIHTTGRIKMTGNMVYSISGHYVPTYDMVIDGLLKVPQQDISTTLKGKTTFITTVATN